MLLILEAKRDDQMYTPFKKDYIYHKYVYAENKIGEMFLMVGADEQKINKITNAKIRAIIQNRRKNKEINVVQPKNSPKQNLFNKRSMSELSKYVNTPKNNENMLRKPMPLISSKSTKIVCFFHILFDRQLRRLNGKKCLKK